MWGILIDIVGGFIVELFIPDKKRKKINARKKQMIKTELFINQALSWNKSLR